MQAPTTYAQAILLRSVAEVQVIIHGQQEFPMELVLIHLPQKHILLSEQMQIIVPILQQQRSM